MKLLKTEKWGSLFVDDRIEDRQHMRIARDLVTRLILSMVERNFDFYLNYSRNDYPLRYNERGLNGLFLTSISDVTKVYLSEIPVIRKSDDGKIVPPKVTDKRTYSNNGRMDCWALYRGVDFCIELKQGFHFARLKPRDALKKNWNKLVEQTNEAKTHIANDSNSTVGVGVLVVPCFEYAKRTEDLKFNNPSHILSHQLDEIEPKPTWAAEWKPPDGHLWMDTLDRRGAPQIESVPSVLFLCSVE